MDETNLKVSSCMTFGSWRVLEKVSYKLFCYPLFVLVTKFMLYVLVYTTLFEMVSYMISFYPQFI